MNEDKWAKMTKYCKQCEINNMKNYWQKCEEILTKKNFLNSHCDMTVPVKQGYKLVVYHCDVKTNE